MFQHNDFRQYNRHECIVFRKTDEKFGGLSNMAGGYPIVINDIHIRTSEAIYQACRYPHSKEIQEMIISQKSPMTAKMKSKPYHQETRHDWTSVRIDIMRWCLRLKLACNYKTFSNLLTDTKTMSIVEESHKDQFWGTVADKNDILLGMNILGRLLMELREAAYKDPENEIKLVPPPSIKNFHLYGKEITTFSFSEFNIQSQINSKLPARKPTQLNLPFTI